MLVSAMGEIADILRQIVLQRRARVEEALAIGTAPDRPAVPSAGGAPRGADFVRALRSAPRRAVIAEVKLGSPRLGSLAGTIDPEAQARLYANNGAACLSVVVEPDFFFGSYDLLTRCRRASGLPTLAKDFVVHPIQLEWARRAGADAVLLIAALLSADDLHSLANRARQLGLMPLVECHSASELALLAGTDWELVGINNRDLRTFEVSLEQSMAMLPGMPSGAVKVAESGIRSGRDLDRLVTAGFDAFLVGESLLLAPDPAAKLRELVGTRRGE